MGESEVWGSIPKRARLYWNEIIDYCSNPSLAGNKKLLTHIKLIEYLLDKYERLSELQEKEIEEQKAIPKYQAYCNQQNKHCEHAEDNITGYSIYRQGRREMCDRCCDLDY